MTPRKTIASSGVLVLLAACGGNTPDPSDAGTGSTNTGAGGATTITSSTTTTPSGTGGQGGMGTTTTTTTNVGGQGGSTTGTGGAGGTMTGAGGQGGTTTTSTSTTTTSTSSTSSSTTTPPLACVPASIPAAYKLTSTRSWAMPASATPDDEVSWPSMAFDPTRGEVLLFGGRSTRAQLNYPYLYDPVSTWSWNGTVWTQVAGTATSPSARTGFTMVYDKKHGQGILFGGLAKLSSNMSPPLNDTWAWDGTAWHQVPVTGTLPPPRSNYAMAYDSETGTILLHGGIDASSNSLADTWRWDGAHWTNVTPAAGSPSARAFHAMAYDPIRKRTVLFGGAKVYSGALNAGPNVWEWDGAAWTDVGYNPMLPQPPGGANVAMVFDPSRNVVVAYGGTVYGAGGPTDEAYDYHAWNGVTWTKIFPGGPTTFKFTYAADNSVHAHHFGMAYDDCRNRIVLYRHVQNFTGGDFYEFETTGHPNNAPVFQTPLPTTPVQVFPGEAVSIPLKATDADADVLDYTGGALPVGSQISPGASNTASFSWLTKPADAGDYVFTFSASDGTATAVTTVPVHVGALTYPYLPTSTALNTTFTGTFGMGFCYLGSNGLCTGNKLIPNSVATCTFTGTNPGRATASCTVHIPYFTYTDSFGTTNGAGPYDEAGSGFVKGDSTFSGGNNGFGYTGGSVAGPAAYITNMHALHGSLAFDQNGVITLQ